MQFVMKYMLFYRNDSAHNIHSIPSKQGYFNVLPFSNV